MFWEPTIKYNCFNNDQQNVYSSPFLVRPPSQNATPHIRPSPQNVTLPVRPSSQNATLHIRPSSSKVTPLVRPEFECIEIVKYY